MRLIRMVSMISVVVLLSSILAVFPTPSLAQTHLPLPDLVVKAIECGPGNKLQVTIENSGLGPLPGGWMAVADVYFNGQRKGFFGLNNPTSTINGGIETPGGSSVYLLAWDITALVKVLVIADSTNGIEESNEQNNSKEEAVEPLDEFELTESEMSDPHLYWRREIDSLRSGETKTYIYSLRVKILGLETRLAPLLYWSMGHR